MTNNDVSVPIVPLSLPTEGIAALLHRAVAAPEIPVAAYVDKLPKPWNHIATAVINCPPDPTERSRALTAALSPSANAGEVQAAIARGDVETPLTCFPEFKERFAVHGMAEVFEPQPPQIFTLDQLIVQGSLVTLIGPPGGGKTWAGLDMVVCVAKGENFGDIAVTQTGVLIIDEESGSSRLKQRILKVANGHGIKATDRLPLYFITRANTDFAGDNDAKELIATIRKLGVGLVLIDALVDVMVGCDENSVKETQPVLKRIRKVAEETGATIILLHHTGKNKGQSGETTYRGSTAIKGEVDLMIKIVSKENGILKFTTDKERDIAHREFAMQMNFGNDSFRLSVPDENSTPAEKSVQLSGSKRFVIASLGEFKALRRSEIAAKTREHKEEAIRKAITALQKETYICRTDGQGKGKVATFELTESGKELYARLASPQG